MEESKLEIKHKVSEKDYPGNTPIGARIYSEAGHNSWVCTLCEKNCNLYQHCSDKLKMIASEPKDVKTSPKTIKVKNQT